MDLTIEGFKGKNIRLCVPKLFKDIDPEKSKFTVKSSSISITLKKEKEAKWANLKAGDKDSGLGGGMPGMGGMGGMPGMGGMGGMPGMGGMGGMPGMEGMGGMPDMGDMDGMPDMGAMGGEDGQDPNKGLMDMMKKMYEEGDEETKKMMTEAMMKGMQDKKE